MELATARLLIKIAILTPPQTTATQKDRLTVLVPCMPWQGNCSQTALLGRGGPRCLLGALPYAPSVQWVGRQL